MLEIISFWDWIKSACAPANEDSDWAKSDEVIWPLSSLALLVSTCLSNKLRLLWLIFNFLLASINPE